MAPKTPLRSTPTTLTYERFWKWLQGHPNCILRAGTPEAALFDDEDFHWHFSTESDDSHLVQVVRGKRVVGELILQPREVAYVEAHPGDSDEFLFEGVSESETERQAVFFFVLSHAYDAEEPASGPGRWTH